VLLFSTVGFAGAEEFQLKSGTWKVEREMGNSLKKAPETSSTQVCVQSGGFDPMRELMLPPTCEISDRKESPTQLTWAFKCGGGGMPESTGKGSFTTDGDTAQGEINMISAYTEETVTIYNKWSGRFVSDQCEATGTAKTGAGM